MGPDFTTTDCVKLYYAGNASEMGFGSGWSVEGAEHEQMLLDWDGDTDVRVSILGAGELPAQVTAVPRPLKIKADNASFRVFDRASGRLRAVRRKNFAGKIDRETALASALSFAERNGFPESAKPVRSWPIVWDDLKGNSMTVGYYVELGHSAHGIPVSGDSILIAVESDGVKLVDGTWHKLDTKPVASKRLKRIGRRGLQACLSRLRKDYPDYKKMPKMDLVRPVYYVGRGKSGKARKARLMWQVAFEDGQRYHWDADTGKVLGMDDE